MYAAEGSCDVLVAEQSGDYKKISLKEGEYIFLDGGIPHGLFVERGSPCRVLNLEIALVPTESGLSLKLLSASDAFERLLKKRALFYRSGFNREPLSDDCLIAKVFIWEGG